MATNYNDNDKTQTHVILTKGTMVSHYAGGPSPKNHGIHIACGTPVFSFFDTSREKWRQLSFKQTRAHQNAMRK